MKLIDNLNLWYKCRTTGRIEEYKEYKKVLEIKKEDINRFSKYLSDATEKFQNIQQRFPESSKEYIEARNEMQRWQYTLDEAKLELKYIRPNSQEDIQYRENTANNFTNELKKVLSSNLNLRFHGTPIYFAEQIIKSGNISSSADRYNGYIKSTDLKGEISASDIETLDRTIQFFSDMSAYQQNLPAGCIFAILPKDNDDPSLYKANIMPSVNFKQNPEQLFGVFTTPENVERLKEWMKDAGFNANLAYTFEEFLEVAKIASQKSDELPINKVEDKENKENNNNDITITTEVLERIDKGINAKERQEAFNAIKSAKLEMNKEILNLEEKEKGEEK